MKGTVMVVGAGQMGSGIAQVAAQAGREVVLVDVGQDRLEWGRKNIASSLARLVKRGSLGEDAARDVTSRIRYATDVGEGRGAALAVEAIVEALDPKRALLSKLDETLGDEAVLASNTSTLPITELGSAVRRPERVIGMHFMNPPPVMALVEVVRGLRTSDETFQAVWAEAEAYGKTPVAVNDRAGFVSNRVLMPMINEAIYCLMEGVATAEAIDTVMRLGMSHPIGPLALADLIGLDTTLAILEILHEDLGEDKYRPCPLLRTYVRAGYLGRKSGRGFYDYARTVS